MSSWVDQIDDRIRLDIAKFGVHVMGSESADGLPWLHTIGLLASDLPEMVMVGMDFGRAHQVLNAIARWCFAHPGDPIMPGREFTVRDYNPALTWRAAKVSKAWCEGYMFKMDRFYPGKWRPGHPGCVVQVLWPDAHGNHPGPLWSPDFQPLLATWQPGPAPLPQRAALIALTARHLPASRRNGGGQP